MNEILCSSGALIGKVNGYDYSLIKKYIPLLFKENLINGMEFMMIPFYYDILNDVIDIVMSCEIPTPIIHCEKDVGVLLSACNPSSTNQALELFKINCETGKRIGAQNMVFHLWGGLESDSHIEYNISVLPQLIDIANENSIRLLVENIPCTTYSGLENWRKLYSFLPNIDFIFDTRFGAFHDEIEDILSDPLWKNVRHIHISDYSSHPRDFSKIRPILHPGEGVIDFNRLFERLKEKKYGGSVTLESPVMLPNGIDFKKLKSTLIFLKNNLL